MTDTQTDRQTDKQTDEHTTHIQLCGPRSKMLDSDAKDRRFKPWYLQN